MKYTKNNWILLQNRNLGTNLPSIYIHQGSCIVLMFHFIKCVVFAYQFIKIAVERNQTGCITLHSCNHGVNLEFKSFIQGCQKRFIFIQFYMFSCPKKANFPPLDKISSNTCISHQRAFQIPDAFHWHLKCHGRCSVIKTVKTMLLHIQREGVGVKGTAASSKYFENIFDPQISTCRAERVKVIHLKFYLSQPPLPPNILEYFITG